MTSTKTNSIVISQPYFFPWIGMFEQINFADTFVHYDDVQYSKGHFQDRVQIKTLDGFKWLTVKKREVRLGKMINEIQLEDRKDWRKSHLDFLKQVFRTAPFFKDTIELVEDVYSKDCKNVAEISIASVEAVLDYYNMKNSKQISKSSDLNISGKSTERVLSFCKHFNATNYITGMGALNYFDFNLFEKENIRVEFIDYARSKYPQLYGEFNPHVSILDLIANTGKEGVNYFNSKLIYWQEFIKSKEAIDYLK
jgi:hypothetical protein